MNRTAVVILALAVAILGASLGIVGGISIERHMRGARLRGFGPGGPPPLRNVLPRLARALDLTPEQVARIEPKVLKSQKEFEAARESLRSRIDAELTPEQRERLKQLERNRHRAFPDRPGMEPGPPDRHDGVPGDSR